MILGALLNSTTRRAAAFRAAATARKAAVAALLSAAAIAAAAPRAGAGIVSPRPGVKPPEAYLERIACDKQAYMLRHAWLERRIRQRSGEKSFRPLLAAGETAIIDPSRSVSGTLRVPVVLGFYSDASSPPISPSLIQQELFDGPWSSGTLHDYWNENSYGLLDVTGTVFDWVDLAQGEGYYVGTSNGLSPGYAQTGELIAEAVGALDPATDFGLYDNDGPDGVPNSGDDDGFVDILVVMHPTEGAECTSPSIHMWSHSWIYSNWPNSGGNPYETNDAAAGGGFIKIEDYLIVPTISCEGGQIEIGVICHELGHGLGLPDLYDFNGGSTGVGYWCLMGAGNWNTPAYPAHLCAWSKEQMGWLNPIDVDWRERSITLRPIETSADAVRLVLPTKRFQRRQYTPAGVQNGLAVGYSYEEGRVREWPGRDGYGNGWTESMCRSFQVDASRPVTLSYDVIHDTEQNWDFGKLLIERDGAVETLGVYTGEGSDHVEVDLTSHLPAGPCAFTLRFLFLSDVSFSDEGWYGYCGIYDSQGGYSFTIDNLSLAGGGLDYSTDFEADAGGWRRCSEPAEYFIVENRRRLGFDSALPGEGLVIWHAENSIAYSCAGNSGGSMNTMCRGLVLEEADGRYDLITSDDLGDSGDPYPGFSGKTSFTGTTVPRSQSNGGFLTPVSITGIRLSGEDAQARFRGGMPPPVIDSVSPDTLDFLTDDIPVLDVRGSWFLEGAACLLAMGRDTIEASSVDWLGEERLVATFPAAGLYAGSWTLVVESGDGQRTALPGALTILSVYVRAEASPALDRIALSWEIIQPLDERGCLVYRSADGGPFERITVDTLQPVAGGAYEYRDASVAKGAAYSYRIVTVLADGSTAIYMLWGPYATVDLFTCYPNPFAGKVRVSFYAAARTRVRIDVYDASGKLVTPVTDAAYPMGQHFIDWYPSRSELSPGVYFCVLRMGSLTRTLKLVHVR